MDLKYADGDNGAITKTDNVVIMKVRNHPDGNRDVLGAPSVQSDTVGKGTVTSTATERRSSVSGSERRPPLRFASPTSPAEPIELKPGQTWVALAG